MTSRAQSARPRPCPRPRPRFVTVSSGPSGPSSSSRSASVSSWDVWPVGVEWDEFRCLHIARCQRCADSCTSSHAGKVDDWVDTHRCDPELVALLALDTDRRAA